MCLNMWSALYVCVFGGVHGGMQAKECVDVRRQLWNSWFSPFACDPETALQVAAWQQCFYPLSLLTGQGLIKSSNTSLNFPYF